MCLAMPAQIIELLANDKAIISIGGVTKEITTTLVSNIKLGDYVIVHVGYALTKLSEIEANKTLKLFADMEAQAL